MVNNIQQYQSLTQSHLQAICEACHGTSIWLAHHNFNKRFSTIVAEYIAPLANFYEKDGDIGERYPEGIQSRLWDWLRSENPKSFQFTIDDIPTDQLERLEYIENDVKSIVALAVYQNNRVWGYLEIWESRSIRRFTPDELEQSQQHIEQLESILASLPKE